ncbi:2-hydroxychromene-2-carboxylate isomerase [Sphaceloma murrayae]|uniref:Glutathione S-transferase kappa n=1 Tax=Sphaceloma murrayae TaxID=2082308 RepID=A0A2K1QZQ8_9PEZI|nr:2-hydroxychromene-2-carboxylate isomerase [Sphaceloma murrayae]
MARPKLTLYLDVVSPFGYLAFHVIHNSPIFKSCDVKYVPILLGGVMKACANTPPIKIKNKDKWINQDRLRWARMFNIPVAQDSPKGFPHNTVSPMRALAALEQADPSKLAPAFMELYKAYWVQGQPIDKPDVFGPALEKALGKDEAKKYLDAIATPEAKAHLIKNTEQAVENGAFGMPWMLATNSKGETEGFWGFDHLGQVVEYLGLERGDGLRAML